MKRVLCVLLSFVLVLGTASTAYASYQSPYSMSKAEIKELVDATTFDSDDYVLWDESPNVSLFRAGSLTQEMQEKGLQRLNMWRAIAGLQPVSLKEEFSELAQYAAVMEAKLGDHLDHRPDKPYGMPDDFYEKGYEGSSHGNLTAGVKYSDMVDLLMADHFGRNLPTVGHRRWMLNPFMQYTGFGYAEDSNARYKRFGVVYALDQTLKTVPYDYWPWPSAGYFPSNTKAFDATTPWTISLGPQAFGKVYPHEVKVELVRKSDGKTWNFSTENTYKAEDTGDYFTVSTNFTGGANAIIFRPEVNEYEGVWEVTATVKSPMGQADQVINYTVEFFDTDAYDPAMDVTAVEEPEASRYIAFSDVSPDSWAWDYILEAAEDGAFLGYNDGRFGPNDAITAYQLAAVILRGYYGEEINTRAELSWSAMVDELAEQYHLWDGLQDCNKSRPLTREQMAQILFNVLGSNNGPGNKLSTTTVTFDDLEGSVYRGAITACVAQGILAGVSDSKFDAESPVTRAQAAVVYCRLKSVLDN